MINQKKKIKMKVNNQEITKMMRSKINKLSQKKVQGVIALLRKSKKKFRSQYK